jgi:hypothetical protein
MWSSGGRHWVKSRSVSLDDVSVEGSMKHSITVLWKPGRTNCGYSGPDEHRDCIVGGYILDVWIWEQSADAWPFNSATLVCVKREVFHNPVEGGGGHVPRGAPRLDGQRYNSRGSKSCPGSRGGTMVFWSALPSRISSSESFSPLQRLANWRMNCSLQLASMTQWCVRTVNLDVQISQTLIARDIYSSWHCEDTYNRPPLMRLACIITTGLITSSG